MTRDPDFLIAGAMRSGTTSLHHWLRGHPGVVMSVPKEVHYFDVNYERGRDWYHSHFPAAGHEELLGESTPEYLFLPAARARMCSDLPRARIVVTLRDPVERAWSHYSMLAARGRETLSFAEALDAEEERLRHPASWSRYGYAAKGLYADQLSDLFDRVGRDRVLVLLFERDIVARPADAFRELCTFLGLDESVTVPAVGSSVNAAIALRSPWLRDATRWLPKRMRNLVGKVNTVTAVPESMPVETRRRLVEVFREPNRRLEALLGTDIPEWTQSDAVRRGGS